jgi:hypothetical protein
LFLPILYVRTGFLARFGAKSTKIGKILTKMSKTLPDAPELPFIGRF